MFEVLRFDFGSHEVGAGNHHRREELVFEGNPFKALLEGFGSGRPVQICRRGCRPHICSICRSCVPRIRVPARCAPCVAGATASHCGPRLGCITLSMRCCTTSIFTTYDPCGRVAAQCPSRPFQGRVSSSPCGVVDNFGCEIEVAGVEALCCGSEDKVIIRLVQLPHVDTWVVLSISLVPGLGR